MSRSRNDVRGDLARNNCAPTPAIVARLANVLAPQEQIESALFSRPAPDFANLLCVTSLRVLAVRERQGLEAESLDRTLVDRVDIGDQGRALRLKVVGADRAGEVVFYFDRHASNGRPFFELYQRLEQLATARSLTEPQVVNAGVEGLERLARLRAGGYLTDAEYDLAKRRFLDV